jgi:hypothetical protein
MSAELLLVVVSMAGLASVSVLKSACRACTSPLQKGEDILPEMSKTAQHTDVWTLFDILNSCCSAILCLELFLPGLYLGSESCSI